MQVTIYCSNCNTFSIYQVEKKEDIKKIHCKHCECDYEDRMFSIIDEDIAPAIILLNNKGYTTEFCCAGHLGENENDTKNKYYSIPYITFKSLYTTPSTAPSSWRFEDLSSKNIDDSSFVALFDSYSRSMYTIRKQKITKELRDTYLQSLYEWAKNIPQLYTNPNNCLYYKRKKMDKYLDAKIITSKIYNWLWDKIYSIYKRLIDPTERTSQIGYKYTVDLKAINKNQDQITISSILEITGIYDAKLSGSTFEIKATNISPKEKYDREVYNASFKINHTRASRWEDEERFFENTNITRICYIISEFIINNNYYDIELTDYVYNDKDYYFNNPNIKFVSNRKKHNDIKESANYQDYPKEIKVDTINTSAPQLSLPMLDEYLEKKIDEVYPVLDGYIEKKINEFLRKLNL